MKNLNEIREKINEVDEALIKSFKLRMALVKEVALYKKENNMPIFDSKREEELIKKNISLLNDKELEEYYLNFFNSLLSESKKYQKKVIDND